MKFRKFGDTAPPKTGFEYLLVMQIASLTYERKLELEKMFKAKADELSNIKKTKIQQMLLNDLEVLEGALNQLYKDDLTQADATTKLKKSDKKGPKRKDKDGSDDDDDDKDSFGSDAEELMKRPAAVGSSAKLKKLKLWKPGKKGGKGKGKKGKKGDDEDEDEEEGDEKKPDEDPTENIFSDSFRWAGGVNVKLAGIVNKKARF